MGCSGLKAAYGARDCASMREAVERRHDPLAHGCATLVPGVRDEAQPSVWPRARQVRGCVWRAAHVVLTMQQHAGNAGESVRVAQEHTFFEPCGMREVVRSDADEGDARRRWSVAVRSGGAVRLGGEHGVLPGAPVSSGTLGHLWIVTIHQARVGGDEVVSVRLGNTRAEAFPSLRKEASDPAV